MKILIDIGHPAHVHLFRNFARIMQEQGNKIIFTVRKQEHEISLLQASGYKYCCLGEHYSTATGKLWGLLKFNRRMFRIARIHKPDVFLSHGSIYAAHVAWLMRKPHIALEDSANMEQVRLYRPFSRIILTPDALPQNLGKKQRSHKSYHELAYLHPRYFRPSPERLKDLGVDISDPYCVMRFVHWKATHDYGNRTLSWEERIDLARSLSKRIRVLISSETTLPDELKEMEIKIRPEFIHHLLALATLYVGEGATMAAESGVLGTPAIYINRIVRYYNEDLERYGLVYNFRSLDGVLEKAREIIEQGKSSSLWQKNRQKILEEKEDLTEFLVEYVKSYTVQ